MRAAVVAGLVLVVLIGVIGAGRRRGRASATTASPRRSNGAPTEATLSDALARAVRRGLITADTADAIVAAEVEPSTAPTPRLAHGLPATAEAIGYVGGVLALTGMVFLVGRSWHHFGQPIRLGLTAGLAGVLIAVGAVLREDADPAWWRLRGFLWLLGTGSAAGCSVVTTVGSAHWHGAAVVATTGGVTALVSAVLWQRRDRPAQHTTTLVGVVLGVGGAMAMADGAGAVGISVLVVGLAWALLGADGVVPPSYVAVPLGLATALVGPALSYASWHRGAPLLGLGVASVAIGVGSARRTFVAIAAGVVALLGYVPLAVAQWFGSTLKAPGVMLISGVGLLAAMLVLIRRRQHHSSRPWRLARH